MARPAAPRAQILTGTGSVRGTHLEFRDKARTGEGVFGEHDPSWEGLVELAVFSAARQPARQGKIEGFLPATSFTLAPGEERTFGFTFRWASDYPGLHDALYEAGVVDVVSLPGVVIPRNIPATLAVRARGGIERVVAAPDRGVQVTHRERRGEYEVYELRFSRLGPTDVTVGFDGGREAVLQYYAIAPVSDLVDSHARFLTTHQQARGTSYGYEGAFLQWDMSQARLLTWHNYPGGGWKQWMVGGSDDLGLSPALFLAERNLIDPDPEQVAAVDYYLEHFIWGYLQSQTDERGERTYRVYHWYDGGDGGAPHTEDGLATWRVMNYPHVWNTYLTMFRIADTYPTVATALTGEEYLLRAGRTALAYFDHPNAGVLDDASREMGSMGEMSIPALIEALQSRGHRDLAVALETRARAKAREMLSRDYPFASEMSIDTTAFEAVHTLARWVGDEKMVHKVTRASMAARGLQPLWYYYGSDNRHMGESWWNLGYETHLGAWQQQDYLLHLDPADGGLDADDLLRSTYGAYLAGWANVNAGQISADPRNLGAASWQYQSQKGSPEPGWSHMPLIGDGWWAWSGEVDLGLWGGLLTAAVHVVEDRVVGPYAYGGDLVADGGGYEVMPRDGVGRRLVVFPVDRLVVDLVGARYTWARVSADGHDIELHLTPVGPSPARRRLHLKNLEPGAYEVTGTSAHERFSVTCTDGLLTLPLTSLADGPAVVVVRRLCAIAVP